MALACVKPASGAQELGSAEEVFAKIYLGVLIVLLDLISLGILGVGGLIGWHKGLFRMLARLLGIVLSLVITCMITGSVCNMLYDKLLAPQIERIVVEKAEEIGAEETVQSVYDIVSGLQTKIDTSEVSDVLSNAGSALDGITADSPLTDYYAKFSSFFNGFNPGIMDFIADKVDISDVSEVLDSVQDIIPSGDEEPSTEEEATAVQMVAKGLSGTFKAPILNFMMPIAFFVFMAILSVVCCFLLNFVVGLLEKIKIAEKASKIAGLCIGAICAFAVVLALALVMGIIATPDDGFGYDIVNGSVVLSLSNSIKDAVLSGIPDISVGKIVSSVVSDTSSNG